MDRLLAIAVALLGGILFSFCGKPARTYLAFSGKAQGWGVIALVFLIGFLVGSNPQAVQNFAQVGWRALLISSFSVAGSIVFACFGEKHLGGSLL
ncbi:MAG: LysO family transporter [Candidatus Atribacteria bacterium]|nr:LysO family transporter [Candidatus Atribacteria bacterium]MCD6350383.1 LysO family transporter [Candidatus Atribacteria bacterium]